MDLSFNLAPSYRDLKDPTTRQNFDDTVEQKRVIDMRACHIPFSDHDGIVILLKIDDQEMIVQQDDGKEKWPHLESLEENSVPADNI